MHKSRPLWRIPTVSASRRTSSSMWLEISTVWPRSQIVRNTPSRNSSRAIGSRPESGSSNNSSSGSCDTASNSASFTCVPFERCLTFFSKIEAEQLDHLPASLVVPRAEARLAETDHLADAHPAVDVMRLGHVADPLLDLHRIGRDVDPQHAGLAGGDARACPSAF